MGGPNMCPTNPRQQMAIILKIDKSPYHSNCSSDCQKIWHSTPQKHTCS